MQEKVILQWKITLNLCDHLAIVKCNVKKENERFPLMNKMILYARPTIKWWQWWRRWIITNSFNSLRISYYESNSSQFIFLVWLNWFWFISQNLCELLYRGCHWTLRWTNQPLLIKTWQTRILGGGIWGFLFQRKGEKKMLISIFTLKSLHKHVKNKLCHIHVGNRWERLLLSFAYLSVAHYAPKMMKCNVFYRSIQHTSSREVLDSNHGHRSCNVDTEADKNKISSLNAITQCAVTSEPMFTGQWNT